MRDLRSSAAVLVVGVGLGLVAGLFIAAKVTITEDRWWALAGSALGAMLAIAGSLFVVHYESRQSERADRRRLADQINGILKLLSDTEVAAREVPPLYVKMREAIRSAAAEYQLLYGAVQQVKHTSVEIARASKFIGQNNADGLGMFASSNHDSAWDENVRKHIANLQRSLTRAKAELRA